MEYFIDSPQTRGDDFNKKISVYNSPSLSINLVTSSLLMFFEMLALLREVRR
jgi:hypothetical protein